MASSGKPGGLVIGVGGVIVIILVTGETDRQRSRIPAGVTIDTIQKRMRAGYRKLRLAVIERACIPAFCSMALGAIVTEIISNMIRIIRTDVIILMAGPAIRRRAGIAVGMAFHAI